MKLFYFDLETTGVKHWENGIHQISGAIEINGEIKERFNYRVRPNEKAIIDPAALAVSGVTEQQVKAYGDQRNTYLSIIMMLSKYVDKFNRTDKFFLVGFNNASFDNQFLREFFSQCGDKYFGSWFWSNSIDVMVLAAEHLKNQRGKMVDFKLKTVAAQLGAVIDESKLHDAMYDIELTIGIYKQITNR